MRNAFINALTYICENDENTILLTGDLGFGVFEKFKERFPKQYLNAGVAEANMVGMAAGLAMSGMRVYVYSIAPFLVYRAFEQIRDDVCYHNLPVRIIGVGGGLAYGNAGPTHHATEDIALMTAIPNMTVVCPGDPIEVEKALLDSFTVKGPIYFRLNRSGDSVIHDNAKIDFKIGKGLVIKEGQDILLVTTGNMLEVGDKVSKGLDEVGYSTCLISMHTLKPFDSALLTKTSVGKKLIVSMEEHSPFGGLFSLISQTMVQNHIHTEYLPFTMPDSFARISASQNYLRKAYGLDHQTIIQKIIDNLEKEAGKINFRRKSYDDIR
ncbi:MAG: transketolase C-terminal domain-containing protein [Thermoplasmatales archaeon]